MPVDLVALDVDSEDKAKVELGGLASLDRAKLLRYVPDAAGFERFGSTRAFDTYVSYTLRPPYTLMQKVGQKMTMSTDVQRGMSFENFLARQAFRDESMASASAAWLTEKPTGTLLGLVGVNHVKFACGVPGRTARMIPGGLDAVTSVLLNPTPASTFVDPLDLRVCDRTLVANEACLLNDIEVQNYVMQLPFSAARGAPAGGGGGDGGGGGGGGGGGAGGGAGAGASAGAGGRGGRARSRVDQDDAVSAKQAKKGQDVLALSDYVIFSPTQ